MKDWRTRLKERTQKLDQSDSNRGPSYWTLKPSETYPFLKSYQTTGSDGCLFRVDFNHGKRLVRVAVETPAPDSQEYYAIMKSGTLIRERESGSETPTELAGVIGPLRHIFSSLPNDRVLQLIGGNYGIDMAYRPEHHSRVYLSPALLKDQPAKNPWDWIRKKFIIPLWEMRPRRQKAPLKERFLRRVKDDLLDFSVAAAGGWTLYNLYYDYCTIGKSVAMFGMFTGVLDWQLRGRNPLALKVLSIGLPAGALYLYGYLYQ